MTKPKIGLLPLYLALYDSSAPKLRRQMEAFVSKIALEFKKRDTDVVKGPIACVAREFKSDVALFEKKEVDAIVTLHLTYSPSLESAGVLAQTRLPVLVLDTTPDYDFKPGQSTDRLMSNHGIHGVQDLCNLLKRNNQEFQIEAGHW
jgi:L-arabinose isomerase